MANNYSNGVVILFIFLMMVTFSAEEVTGKGVMARQKLRFDPINGEFRILQVADMHYANGKATGCRDVLPSQIPGCSDLNTTAFLRRMIRVERPHLIVFTGDNIYGSDSTNSSASLDAAFSAAIESNIPWTAVLGNHDQEGTLSREGVMKHIVGMKNTLSQLNPVDVEFIDGFGNYNLEVNGIHGFENKSLLNLYFLDSGDYSHVSSIGGYGWIQPSQQLWFQQTSKALQRANINNPPAPGLAYFHIPLPEYRLFKTNASFKGVKKEPDIRTAGISSASVNSGFFATIAEAGDVKAVFTGHDHLNDFCGELIDIHLCYAGGFGYHAYGEAGWSRRARMVTASLERVVDHNGGGGGWGAVKYIKTWKRLDDLNLSMIDFQVLWSKKN